jgi:hypothetical protein
MFVNARIEAAPNAETPLQRTAILFTDVLNLPDQRNIRPGSNERDGRNGDQRPREIVLLD